MTGKSGSGEFGELASAALGMVTTAVTAFVLGYIAVEYDLAIYSFMLFFILPVGAIAAGLAASSGYYFGALFFHKKPAGGVLLNMVIASLSAFILINYTVFYLLEIEGVPIKEIVDFWKFLDIGIRSTVLSFSSRSHEIGSISELGAAGYLYAAWQLTGFGLGGYMMFLFLADNPYCDDCSQYRKRVFRQERYTSDADALLENFDGFAALIAECRYEDAGKLHSYAMGNEKCTRARYLRTRIDVHSCRSCGTGLLAFNTHKRKGNNWDEIAELSFVVLLEQTPDLN